MSTETTNTAEATGTVSEAAAAFEALLGAEETSQPETRKKAPEPIEAEADEAEALVAASEEEDADPAAEGEEGSEEEADDQVEEPEQFELPLDALVTVKIGDKAEQVSLDEAIKGYQRQSDYQRKTQALAEERKSFYSEVQAVRQERAQYAALLTNLDTQLREAAPKEPDWDALKQENPIEYAIRREEWREAREKQAAVQAEQHRLSQLRAREEQENIKQHIAAEGQRLVEAIPVLKDDKQRTQVQKQLREYGKQLGYTDEELSQAYDHRAVVALYKAMQFDALKSKQPVAQRPVVKASKPAAPTVRPLAAGSANTPTRQVNELTRAKQRLAKTGSVRDAASIFEQLL